MVEKDPRAVAEAAFDREQMREREVSGQRRAEARGGAPCRGRRDHAPAAGAQPVAWTVESVRGAAPKRGSERAETLALLSAPVTDGIARLTSAGTRNSCGSMRARRVIGKQRSGCPKSIITIGADHLEPRRWMSLSGSPVPK
jgi:hypothetical protein